MITNKQNHDDGIAELKKGNIPLTYVSNSLPNIR